MPGLQDYERDIQGALRHENWALHGPNRIVKVVQRLPAGARPLGAVSAGSGMDGFITLAKFLLGRTPLQIEADLGLPPRYLAYGAMVYRFLRLPMIHEYEYELTADHPGGSAFNAAHHDVNYQPGSAKIHQWAINYRNYIPVDENNVVELGPHDPFRYSQ